MQLKIWIDWNFCHCKISNVSCSMIERSLRQGKNLRCWVIMAFNFSRSKIERSPRQGKNLWCWVIMSFIFRWEGWKGHSSDSCCLCAWCLTIDWCVVSPFACLGQESIGIVLGLLLPWEEVMWLKKVAIAPLILFPSYFIKNITPEWEHTNKSRNYHIETHPVSMLSDIILKILLQNGNFWLTNQKVKLGITKLS